MNEITWQQLDKHKQGRFSRFCEKMVLARLGLIRNGYILMRSQGEEYELGDPAADLHACIEVNNPHFFESVTRNGSVGAAESYMNGDWHCSDLTALIQILVRNRHLVDEMETGMARLSGWLMQLMHFFNRNSRQGSRRNISAHYDLGNDLFALFLDKDWMMYSSALYHSENETLEQAQHNKLKALCDKLQLQPSDHLLEIGTGWGGAAIFAARNYGCRVTTTTISRQQYEYACQQVRAAGVMDKVEIMLKDYRDLDGQYDKLLSIEMVEAVGHHYIDDYFAKCADLLKPNGLAVMQAITLEDDRYQQALKSVDFIKRYIFPGSFIPCVTVLGNSAAKARLRLIKLDDIGMSYALTLREWRKRFLDQLDNVKQLGYPAEFVRMWQFYLCYCEGGFLERSISDVHMLFSRSEHRPQIRA